MVGPELVAKESKQEGLDGQKSSFHDIFASTQATASKIARRFNMLVRERLALYNGSNELVDHRVWDITFLSCSVYSFMEAGVERFVLAEKRLEPASAYRKWNGNNGYVFNGQGKISANPTLGLYSGESDMPEIMKTAFATDDNSSFCDSEDGAGSTFSQESCLGFGIGRSSGSSLCPWVATSRGCKRARDEMPLIFRPQPDDYLQAFSHFSYWKSGRRMLVCDLQGVMTRNASSDDGPAGVFELTDPVIHYCSKTGRKQVYGRTDLGKKGMHKFFRTHECNDVCRLLGLPGCWSPGGLGTVEAEKRADAGVEMPPPPLPRASLAKPSYKRRKFI